MMEIKNLDCGQIRLEIDATTTAEKQFCTTIAHLKLFGVMFILNFCERDGDEPARLQITTNGGVIRSLEISDEHADVARELVRRKTACSQLYSSGFDAGCVLVG